MGERPQSLQDQFLNALRKSKSAVTVYLVKGVKLQGMITSFDAFSLLLRRDGEMQLIYKHSISTIQPRLRPEGFEAANGAASGKVQLQDSFLEAARREGKPVTMFLVNGVMLQGTVGGFDQFALLLERSGEVQLVYKHAISTLQPEGALDLRGEGGEG
jgi:host factor-I protein